VPAVGSPDEVGFVAKPELAARMLARALDAGVPAAWATGEEVFGANPGFQHRGDGALTGQGEVPSRKPRLAAGPGVAGHEAARASSASIACGPRVELAARQIGDMLAFARDHRVRFGGKTGELAYYRCFTPPHPADRPGQRRRPTLDGRGGLPS
jgi:hypothetical protein